MALLNNSPSSPSLSFQSLIRSQFNTTTRLSLPIPRGNNIIPNASQRLSFSLRGLKKRSFISLAASHDDSHSESDVEKRKTELDVGAEESEDAWRKVLDTFKEQAVKMQGTSKESYDLYSKKAMVILKETSEQLKIQAEKASKDLSVIAREISEDGKGFLSTAAENSPEEVKDIVEAFTSPPDDLKEVSKVRDFYLGIPYGLILSVGGFLSFMFTGNTSAIRFGVILGCTLLALSISSLRSWKKGESNNFALKGQSAIAVILLLQQLSILIQRPSPPSFLVLMISGAIVAFYLYRIVSDGNHKKGPSSKPQQGY